MADEPKGGTKKSIEETEENLESAAGERDKAVGEVQTAKNSITASNKKIDELQKGIRSQQDKLPGLEQKQQKAQKEVDDLLSQLEDQVSLKIERLDPSGPVVQGGTAKFRATSVNRPKQTRLSWDTGGCPFSIDGDTITVETGAVGPGDYSISVKLEWVNPPGAPEHTLSTTSAKPLSPTA